MPISGVQELLRHHSIEYTSPITSTKGQNKVEDPAKVLQDDQQLCRFISEFAWNYLKQHIRENKIKFHALKSVSVTGPADEIAVQELISAMAADEHQFLYQKHDNPKNGWYVISTDCCAINANLLNSILVLVEKYNQLGTKIEVTDNQIMVQAALSSPIVETKVLTRQLVSSLGNTNERNNEDAPSAIELVEDNMARESIKDLEYSEAIREVGDSLPTGPRQVFQIMLQAGESWKKFSNRFGRAADTPREAHLAKFLNVPGKQIKDWMQVIKLQCVAKGITPGT